MMPVFCYLLLAHFILDWGLQTQFIAENKHRMWQIMAAHVSIWSLGVCAVLSFFSLFAWWKLGMLFVGHWAEDLYKAKKVANYSDPNISASDYELKKHKYFGFLLNLDQGFHFIQLGLCLI